jgi:hypothetical protein
LRVTGSDEVTKIPFWIENWDATATSASIWVKVPSIPSGGTTIYLYYGNDDPPGPQLVGVPPVGPWTKPAGNPIKPIGDPHALDGTNLLAENIVYDEATGRYWMIFANYRTSSVGLVWSTTPGDPASWNWHGDVISSANAPHIINHDGTWYIFYSHGAWPFGIYVSSSTIITGPYTEQTSVLGPGTGWQSPAADWEAARVDEPYVFQRADGKWILVYMGDRTGYASGCDGCTGPTEQIGYAVADDITGPYTKYAGNPVLRFGPPGTFDAGTIADAWVVEFQGTYYIGYTVSSTKNSPWRTAIATTTDWVNFSKGGVILNWGATGAWDQCCAFRGAVTRIGETYYFPYTGRYCGTPPAGEPTGYIMGIATQPAFMLEKINTCDDVFEFCDSFNTDGDLSKWTSNVTGPGSATVSGGILNITAQRASLTAYGFVQLVSNKIVGTGTLLEARGRHQTAGNICNTAAADNGAEVGFKPFNFSWSPCIRVMDYPFAVHYTLSTNLIPSPSYLETNIPLSTDWIGYQIYRDTLGNANFWIGGDSASLPASLVPTGDLAPWLMSYVEPCAVSNTFEVDWIHVRKWCGSESSTVPGDEQAFNTPLSLSPAGAGTYELGSTVTLRGQISDYDGDLVAYSWKEGDSIIAQGNVQTLAGGTPVYLTGVDVSGFGLGTHEICLVASDSKSDPVTACITVTVIDTGNPTLAPVADQTILWPPDHRMVDVTIQANASDSSGSVTLAATVTSNEPEDSTGDGDTGPDWMEPLIDQATGIITLQLRAERAGGGNGRVYTITITATDSSGNSSSSPLYIIVPHDKRKK